MRLTEVTVRHPGERHPALDAVSFDVEAGARVALIGPTGAGKSTVLSVLLGLVDPTSGRAELGGHDVRGLSSEALHPRMISGLTQDAYLFAGSIRSNLALARPAATEDEMWTALAEAGAADWLRGLDQGLDTVIGPDSALLAGGQRQRIALAVTLLARPGVLVLDEPTESLDDATADAVFADIVRATRGRTTVVASHRVRSVRRFDLIIALANGAIVQKGTHDELMSAGGYYRERYLAESTSTTS